MRFLPPSNLSLRILILVIFGLRGHLKIVVYQGHGANLVSLKGSIIPNVRTITTDQLGSVVEHYSTPSRAALAPVWSRV